MNIELERTQIIEELKYVNDEWLLKAIKRLLGLDMEKGLPEEISDINNKSGEAKKRLSVLQYNKEIDEAMARIDSGEFTTNEDLEKEMETW